MNRLKKIPFFDMEDFVFKALKKTELNFEDLDFEIKKYFTFGFSELGKGPQHDELSFEKRVKYKIESPMMTFRKLSEKEKGFFATLSKNEQRFFLFYSGANFLWDHSAILTEDSAWDERFGPKRFNADTLYYCPLLVDFIKALPFEYTGRVMIMGTNPHQEVYQHFDSFFDEPVVDCLIVRFQSEKLCSRAWVVDHLGQKHLVPLRGYCLDDSFPHLVESVPNFSYSVRIEGKFLAGVRPQSHPLMSSWVQLPKFSPGWENQL